MPKSRITITNSLLRISNVTGEPPPPFEQPNQNLDFWVLELPSPSSEDVACWCSCASKILSDHTELLRQLCNEGSQLTLFIESAGAVRVLRLEAAFLKMLAGLGISIEFSKADN
jgi:hypothetical protein